MLSAFCSIMKSAKANVDRIMECLMRNGDLSSCSSQQLYEVAWEMGIRHVDEAVLTAIALWM
jgi:hypothetical protein